MKNPNISYQPHSDNWFGKWFYVFSIARQFQYICVEGVAVKNICKSKADRNFFHYSWKRAKTKYFPFFDFLQSKTLAKRFDQKDLLTFLGYKAKYRAVLFNT